MPAEQNNIAKIAQTLSPRDVVLLCAIFSGFALLLHGYTLGVENHITQLPLIYRYMDSSYLLNDFYVNSESAFGPRFYYAHGIAFLSKFFPLSILMLLLTYVSYLGIALATFYFARSVRKGDEAAAVIACILSLGVEGFMIGQAANIYKSYLIPSMLARPLVLLAFWAGVSNRLFAWVLLSAAGALLHPLEGIVIPLIGLGSNAVVTVFETSPRSSTEIKATVIKLLKHLFSVIVLMSFFYIFFLRSEQPKVDFKTFLDIFIYFRTPFHYLPSTFSAMLYVEALLFLLAILISFSWAVRDGDLASMLQYRLVTSLVFILALALGGYVFVEVIPIRSWVVAQTFRYLFLLKWIGYIVFAGTISKLSMLNRGASDAFPASFLLIGTGPLQSYSLLLGHMLEILRKRLHIFRFDLKYSIWLFSGLLIFCFILTNRRQDRSELLAIFIMSLVGLTFFLFRKRLILFLFWTAVLACTAGVLANFSIPKVPKFAWNFERSISDRALLDMAKFANRNTENDAVFITPPDFGKFRYLALRAIVVDFKATSFSDRGMVEWKKRIDDCYSQAAGTGFKAVPELDQNYARINTDKLVDLSKKYGARYAVLFRSAETNFSVLYQNDKYTLIKIY